jgi:3-hydroxyacyl-CoA dehydrogenase/enoyl-CoA hydratase/3-hydroxybutyryl-CoA epimerase
MSGESFGDWVTLEDQGGVLLLRLADPSGNYFVFNAASVEELEKAISAIESRGPKGLVVIGTERGFIAGADVNMLLAVDNEKSAAEMSRRGHALFGRLARLACPTVAAIHGPCLGGGLELALSLDWRIATKAKETKLGLPEVRLGILPGWGGTQRLPRLVGLPNALDMMLKGSQLDGSRALKRKLIDRLVPKEWLLDKAIEQVSRGKPRRKLPPIVRFLSFTGIGRGIVRRKVEKTLSAGQGRFFAAPPQILDVTLRGLAAGPAGDFEAEAIGLGKLTASATCKNLIRLFLESEKARKLSRDLDPSAPAVQRAVVVGAGVMGAGIAGVMAKRGIHTRLVDLSAEALSRAVGRLGKAMRKSLKRRQIKPHEYQATMDRLTASTKLAGFTGADVVLEAVAENMDLKRKIFGDAASRVSHGTLLCTNTSSLPLSEMAEGLPHPDRLVGLHFFNPPEKMPLVEVIRYEHSSDTALARAARLAADLGKFPVLVRECAGFLVNRCLSPYLGQAVLLLEEGVTVERIDEVATDFGMPMGPLHLLDVVGWDVAASVCRVMGDAFPERMEPSGYFDAMRDAGLLGEKSRSGIYRYEKGKKQGVNGTALALLRDKGFTRSSAATPDAADIRDRLLLPLVAEAYRCLDEGIVDSEGQCDLAMVMGIGFPPHLGGPITWAQARSLDEVEGRLQILSGRYDQRLAQAARVIEAVRTSDTTASKESVSASEPARHD